jgi:hypothetical protein
LPVNVVKRPKIFTVPRCMPSLLAKVMSRFFIWIVIGTRTVSPVTFTKSDRTSNGIRFVMSFVLTISSRSLNFDRRRRLQLGELLQAVELLGLHHRSSLGQLPVTPDPH